jgi:hypothetical protein
VKIGDLSQQVIDAARAVRTSILWRRSSKDQSQIAKKFAFRRIDDYLATASSPSGVERLTAEKPGPRNSSDRSRWIAKSEIITCVIVNTFS